MLYGFAKFIFSIYFFIFNRIEVKGLNNMPRSGGLILCSNHIHWLDPLLLGVCTKREINFMAKVELFSNNFFSFILKSINAFPVKRGTADISAIKTSFKIIKEGKVLGIFPEGTRSKTGNILPAEPGAALIALKSNMPVIPVRIMGSYKAFKSLKVIIGSPIDLSSYCGRKLSSEEINSASQYIMEQISKLS